MKIELIYDAEVVETEKQLAETSESDDQIIEKSVDRKLHKKYECHVLDRDMIESPKGKDLERFAIKDLQLTTKREVELAIEMLENVKGALDR